MNPDPPHADDPARHSDRPPRRSRYAGTHPRRFEQRYKELAQDLYPEIQSHVRGQGRTPAGTHVPVMVDEVVAALHPRQGNVVVDCTLGYGGHADVLLQHIGSTGRLIGLDLDAAQLERTAQRLGGVIYSPESRSTSQPAPRISLHRCHFAGIGKALAREHLDGCDVILADLGPSSMQLDDPARGFSYKHDGPLDMRMDDRLPHTAADLLARLSEEVLSAALHDFADEPHHDRIAHAIVQRRAAEPITRTRQLVRLIDAANLPPRRTGSRPSHGRARRPRYPDKPHESVSFSGDEDLDDTSTSEHHPPSRSPTDLHPAARTFQALRILVNDELNGLEQLLRVAPYCLRPGGRIAIISFHSGEHRRVEDAFRTALASGLYAALSPAAIAPTFQETKTNPRSRSARLRWAERSL